MDSQQLAESGVWLDQYARATEGIQQGSAASVGLVYRQVSDWYDEALVALAATQAARTSLDAQQAAGSLAEQFIAAIVGVLRGTTVAIQRTELPTPRNGADMLTVYTRPADVYRRAISFGTTEGDALDQALRRAEKLIQADAKMADRDAAQAQMAAVDVQHFRRVIRPELSETGTCGLCIAASTKVYTISDLMPLHSSCKCKTMPIIGSADPGRELNGIDLAQLYEEAGSAKAQDLRQTRYQVNEHGELGPVLTKSGQSFRGPKQVASPPNPVERARKELAALRPVLKILERRLADGENVDGPLQYQRGRIALLARIAA